MNIKEDIIKQLENIVGLNNIFTDKETLVHFDYDATERHYLPDAVITPLNTEQISKIMEICYENNIPVTPQGGKTGLSGGCLPIKGGIILSFKNMKEIIEIDEKNYTATVEPGVVAADFQKAIRERGLFFPPDPSSTVESTIGGNVAENAGYTRAVKYGVTKDYILGLEAVLANGKIVKFGGKNIKDVTGYDIVRLFVGSEGTLAIICKIIVKLLPLPEAKRTLIGYFDDMTKGADLVVKIFQKGIVPTAIEFMDRITMKAVEDYLNVELPDAEAMILVEIDGNKLAVENEAEKILEIYKAVGAKEFRLAKNDEEADRFWIIRRESLPSLKAKSGDQLEADIVVPRYYLPEYVKNIHKLAKEYKCEVATYGHAGDGNLHITIIYHKSSFEDLVNANELLERFYREAIALGGSLTGEHGVGITAAPYLNLQLGDNEIEILRRVKNAFDPKGILNPGKIFDFEE
jgi:glycolate oxidase